MEKRASKKIWASNKKKNQNCHGQQTARDQKVSCCRIINGQLTLQQGDLLLLPNNFLLLDPTNLIKLASII